MDLSARPDDVTYGRRVLEAEMTAIRGALPLVDQRFAEAVALVLRCRGRVVVTGVGKSGLIGQKISATLASTGTPSLFLHSGEAVHGDVGRVLPEDVVLALSYSGTTAEVIRLVPILRKIGASLVALTSTADVPLARLADVALLVGNIEEACPVGLAPTSSTTAMLALGDALAMTVAHRKEFKREDYARFHPGGALGRKLVTVGEVMRPLRDLPVLGPETSVVDSARAMSGIGRPRSGAVLVVVGDGRLVGIFTQGDLARVFANDPQRLGGPVADVMIRSPKTIRRGELLADAYKRLEEHKVDELPVLDEEGRLVGLIDVQDILEWGVGL